MSERTSQRSVETYVYRNMRDWFNVIRQVDSPAVPGLQKEPAMRVQKQESRMDGIKPTSGDSSERMTAPRVSTCMTFGVGNIVQQLLPHDGLCVDKAGTYRRRGLQIRCPAGTISNGVGTSTYGKEQAVESYGFSRQGQAHLVRFE